MENNKMTPDYLFEVSWEVCNKVGGIYTVLSTKSQTLVEKLHNNYILIGPDMLRETEEGSDFIEDPFLYAKWREETRKQGFNIRVGHWNVTGKPVAVLVNFSQYFEQKDRILTDFWMRYKLDSISGGWDYVEPLLFGYAAAQVIESFYNFYNTSSDRIVAQFHEWMTGSGLLYLKMKTPQIATSFTTHATVLGRCIAGNGLPLYGNIEQYNADDTAARFNVKAKNSLEKIAANEADVFTTVSDITNVECRQFLNKDVDVVTPNGFEPNFVPNADEFEQKRQQARQRLLHVAEIVTNQQLPQDSLLLINSGRYEFKNKGIDIFIDTLGRLNAATDLKRSVIAYITIPAGYETFRHDLVEKMDSPITGEPAIDSYTTHILRDYNNDPIIRRLQENNLHNRPEDKVKVVFVPSYLNGNDGILNLNYYDLLIGFDYSVFPSYYEPWGYTPLESIAFGIPTLTTSLSGFGMWIDKHAGKQDAVKVVYRDDTNDHQVIEDMRESIVRFAAANAETVALLRKQAHDISDTLLWSNLANEYMRAYSVALEKSALRAEQYKDKSPSSASLRVKTSRPTWKKVYVKSDFSGELTKLQELSQNLWWCWNYEAYELFEAVDKEQWKQSHHNPLYLLENLTFERIQELEHDAKFLEQLNTVYTRFKNYMDEKQKCTGKQVAYFSMEYGIHDSVKIFSGGLGMLAGDYLKEASDSNVNMVAVGLIYRYGYFSQQITASGEQINILTPQKYSHLPMRPVRDKEGNWAKIEVVLPGRTMHARIWRLDVGRIPLFLLDTDFSENLDVDRIVTHQLYNADWDVRIRQEILLGIGGERALNSMGIRPDIYHCNEGHASFLMLERLGQLIQGKNQSYRQACEVVRSTTLFTTHTPVPAGHDAFSEDMMRNYFAHYPLKLKIDWDTFISLGRTAPEHTHEKFSMSHLAIKLSQETNGVSRIHGRVSREMFANLYPGYFADELHIGYVTNGVHYQTWTHKRWQQLYAQTFGNDFPNTQLNADVWKNIYRISDEVVWNNRNVLRAEMLEYIKQRLVSDMQRRNENPRLIFETIESLNDTKTLTIGFARRFATYKRANLLFTDMEKLNKLLNNPEKPLRFIFAGKAHPSDKAGQDLIRTIIDASKRKEFIGKIIFVENYDISLAKKLISGCDIWLNTPTRPLEASGTSGEKAVMNGVVNFSVLDGWWAEGYIEGAGWALPEENTYSNGVFQNELDAATIYNMLEDEIVPLYYDRNAEGIPTGWVGHVKKTIAEIAPRFTMRRQLHDYYERFYNRLFESQDTFSENNYKNAVELTKWKQEVLSVWDSVHVVNVRQTDVEENPLKLGEHFEAEISIDLCGLSPEYIGVEVVFGRKENEEVKRLVQRNDFTFEGMKDGLAVYRCEVATENAGVWDYAYRIYPKHHLLAYRESLPLIKWA